MSDHENGTTGGEEGVSGMNASEVKFLVTCLNNTTAGSISVSLMLDFIITFAFALHFARALG
jgi:hypothetical protein